MKHQMGFLLLTVAFCYSCSSSQSEDISKSDSKNAKISLQEAKECFISDWEDSPRWQAIPPEFTPEWDSWKFNSKLDCMEIPILKTTIYRVYVASYVNGASTSVPVNTEQALLVNYNDKDELETYIISYIPTEDGRKFSGFYYGISIKSGKASFVYKVHKGKITEQHDVRFVYTPDEFLVILDNLNSLWLADGHKVVVKSRSDGEFVCTLCYGMDPQCPICGLYGATGGYGGGDTEPIPSAPCPNCGQPMSYQENGYVCPYCH